MRLTAHTDYGIRILMTLAMHKDRTATVQALAKQHNISANHLTKVAQSLVAGGLLQSTRGRGGGLHFAHNPADITIGRVVRALETENGFVACLGDAPQTCVFSGACFLTHAFRGALDAFYAALDSHTLADAIQNRQQLLARLLSHGS